MASVGATSRLYGLVSKFILTDTSELGSSGLADHSNSPPYALEPLYLLIRQVCSGDGRDNVSHSIFSEKKK